MRILILENANRSIMTGSRSAVTKGWGKAGRARLQRDMRKTGRGDDGYAPYLNCSDFL